MSQSQPVHFKGKEALGHVIEAQAQGILASAEIHGVEPSGTLSAASDAARETAVILPLFALLFSALSPASHPTVVAIALFGVAWLFWKVGRSSWLGWFRLERLHRILEQERWEIEHHRQQERDELRILYAAKGFEGKLLEDVLDVLMADNDRLLKVMVEEELGLSLGTTEHPLKQGLGAALGVLFASILCLIGLLTLGYSGLLFGGFLALGGASALSAYLMKNRMIPAIVWNLGLASLALGAAYFLLELFS